MRRPVYVYNLLSDVYIYSINSELSYLTSRELRHVRKLSTPCVGLLPRNRHLLGDPFLVLVHDFLLVVEVELDDPVQPSRVGVARLPVIDNIAYFRLPFCI